MPKIDCMDCGNFSYDNQINKAACDAKKRLRFTMPKGPNDTSGCGWFRVKCEAYLPDVKQKEERVA